MKPTPFWLLQMLKLMLLMLLFRYFAVATYYLRSFTKIHISLTKEIEWKQTSYWLKQRTLTIGGSFTVRQFSSFASLESTASLHSLHNIFSFLASSILVKLETSHTVIPPPMMSGLLLKVLMLYKFIEKCDLVIRAYQEQVKSEAEFSWPFLPCDSWVIGWVSDAISSVDYW